jgi:hypothetical protein
MPASVVIETAAVKHCADCGQVKPVENFSRDASRKSGRAAFCKPCLSARASAWDRRNRDRRAARGERWRKANLAHYAAKEALRRAAVIRAVPKWADLDAIDRIYQQAEESRMTVDHIVPLRSPLVCGLHCEANLQVVDGVWNSKKGNRHWPDMP